MPDSTVPQPYQDKNKPIAESQLTLAGQRLAHLMTTIFPNTPVLADQEQIFHTPETEVHADGPSSSEVIEKIQEVLEQTREKVLEKTEKVEKKVEAAINRFKAFLN